ncbi:MAG: hypothetical protein EBV95_06735 [Actinobacteria bacterium]|nr:hypothetical protein [Actinomycetota bacterium]
MTNLTLDTPSLDLKLSAVESRIRSMKDKRKDSKMLSLSYVVEKEGNYVSVENRLMLSEYQINNLMDTLVAHGYTVESMEVR